MSQHPLADSLSSDLGPFWTSLAPRYRLERELRRGGMATVYLMQDLRHDRPVVLKLMNSELAATVAPKRFLREIQLAARLDHPHILPVYDSGEDAGRLWYVMPYVETGSLRERLRRFPVASRYPPIKVISMSMVISWEPRTPTASRTAF